MNPIFRIRTETARLLPYPPDVHHDPTRKVSSKHYKAQVPGAASPGRRRSPLRSPPGTCSSCSAPPAAARPRSCMIAGFIEPTGGRIFFNDRDVTGLAPNKQHRHGLPVLRPVAPHERVAQNVGFGLGVRRSASRRGTSGSPRPSRSFGWTLRRRNQLSGGQQPRAAPGPGGSPDVSSCWMSRSRTRRQAPPRMQRIRHLLRDGITTVYVTRPERRCRWPTAWRCSIWASSRGSARPGRSTTPVLAFRRRLPRRDKLHAEVTDSTRTDDGRALVGAHRCG